MGNFWKKCVTFWLDGTQIEEPRGSENIEFVLNRHTRKMGFNGQYINLGESFTFTGDACAYLVNAYNTEGTDAQVVFSLKADGVTLESANLNFENYDKTREGVTITTEQSSFNTLLGKRGDMQVPIDSVEAVDGGVLTPPNEIRIPLFSTRALRTSLVTVNESEKVKIGGWTVPPSDDSPRGMTVTGNNVLFSEIPIVFPDGYVEDWYRVVNGSPTFSESTFFMLSEKNSAKYTLTLDIDFDVSFTTTVPRDKFWFDILICVKDPVTLSVSETRGFKVNQTNFVTNEGVNILGGTPNYAADKDNYNGFRFYEYEGVSQSNFSASYSGSRTIVFNEDTPLRNGFDGNENQFFWIQLMTRYEGDIVLTVNNLCYKITQDIISPSSYTRVYRAEDVVSHTIESITGTNGLQSNILANTGCLYNNMLSNGLMLREFDDVESSETLCGVAAIERDNTRPVFTFNDLYRHFESTHNMGAGIEGDAVRMEPKEYFFVDSLVLDLGDRVSQDVRITPASELLFKKARIGYDVWDDQTSNNKNEVNSIRTYISPQRSTSNNLELTSPYIAASALIEETRVQQFQSSSDASTEFDNNIFVVQCDSGVEETLEVVGTFPSVSSVRLQNGGNALNPTAFSFEISGAGVNDGVYNSVSTVLDGTDIIITVAGTPFTVELEPASFSYSYTATLFPERINNTSGLNFPNETYNLRLTPTRNMLRALPYLWGRIGYKSGVDLLKFTEVLGNASATTTISDGCDDSVVREDADYGLNTQGDAYFYPDFIEFENTISYDEYNLLRTAYTGANYGYVRFNINGVPTDGWLWEMTFSPTSSKAKFKFLRKR